MPRRPRIATGGYVYHVLNRGVGRMTLFEDDQDYAAFLRVLAEACGGRKGVGSQYLTEEEKVTRTKFHLATHPPHRRQFDALP